MKYLILLAVTLAGCASTGPYDDQFCTVKTSDGRCHAWLIGPGFPK